MQEPETHNAARCLDIQRLREVQSVEVATGTPHAALPLQPVCNRGRDKVAETADEAEVDGLEYSSKLLDCFRQDASQ